MLSRPESWSPPEVEEAIFIVDRCRHGSGKRLKDHVPAVPGNGGQVFDQRPQVRSPRTRCRQEAWGLSLGMASTRRRPRPATGQVRDSGCPRGAVRYRRWRGLLSPGQEDPGGPSHHFRLLPSSAPRKGVRSSPRTPPLPRRTRRHPPWTGPAVPTRDLPAAGNRPPCFCRSRRATGLVPRPGKERRSARRRSKSLGPRPRWHPGVVTARGRTGPLLAIGGIQLPGGSFVAFS